MHDWLYQNNDWAKRHPIFEGLPTGLLDYQFYREILGEKFFGGSGSARRVCGRHDQHIVRLQFRPDGLRIPSRPGTIILNSLLIRENLSAELVASRGRAVAAQHVELLSLAIEDIH